MSQENIQTNPMDEVKNLITQMKDGFESKISSLENQNKELSSKLESVSTVAQKVDEVSKDVSEYKKTQEEIGAQIKMHDKTLENMALQGAKENINAKTTSKEESKDYKSFLQDLHQSSREKPIIIDKNSQYEVIKKALSTEDKIVTAQKSMAMSYSVQGATFPQQPYSTIINEGTLLLNQLGIMQYIKRSSTKGYQPKRILKKFLDDIRGSFEGEGNVANDSQLPNYEENGIEIHDYHAITPAMSNKFYENLINGYYEQDVAQDIISALNDRILFDVSTAVQYGSGINEINGLFSHYKSKGTSAGYQERLIQTSAAGKIEVLIDAIWEYNSRVRVYSPNATYHFMIDKASLKALDLAKVDVYNTPNRSETRLMYDKMNSLSTYIRTLTGMNVEIRMLEDTGAKDSAGNSLHNQYFGIENGKLFGVLGKFDEYEMTESDMKKFYRGSVQVSSNKHSQLTAYAIEQLAAFGGNVLRPKAFEFIKFDASGLAFS